MIKRLAQLLSVREDQLNIKGKTGESVDAVGEEKAIACHCVVLLEKDWFYFLRIADASRYTGRMLAETEFDMLARLLQIQGDRLSPEGARFIVDLHFTEVDHDRIRTLGEIANENALSPDERVEYERYIRLGDLLVVMKTKARLLLKSMGQPGHGLP